MSNVAWFAWQIYTIDTIYPNKLSRLPNAVNSQNKPCKILKTHADLVECKNNCVYSINLPSKSSYIGQTSKCLNVRFTQHQSDIAKIKSTEGKN